METFTRPGIVTTLVIWGPLALASNSAKLPSPLATIRELEPLLLKSPAMAATGLMPPVLSDWPGPKFEKKVRSLALKVIGRG